MMDNTSNQHIDNSGGNVNDNLEPRTTNPYADDAAEQECAVFQSQMAERIGAGEDLAEYPHMQTCERCKGLISDLEAIAQAMKDSFLLDADPSESLWDRIKSGMGESDGSPSHLALEGSEA